MTRAQGKHREFSLNQSVATLIHLNKRSLRLLAMSERSETLASTCKKACAQKHTNTHTKKKKKNSAFARSGICHCLCYSLMSQDFKAQGSFTFYFSVVNVKG